ncbi:hypothetical protein O4H34_19830 [Shewanella colwelliana]|nr:hypothetical protein [Shewanella colwelliana]MCZ4339639.1 hypothetical protein [Shewanella colwelliana]
MVSVNTTKPAFDPALDPEYQASCLRVFDPKEVLLGYQKRWIADESQLKLAEKSRRTGLTGPRRQMHP